MSKLETKLTGVSPYGLSLALAVAGLLLAGDMPLSRDLPGGVQPTVAAPAGGPACAALTESWEPAAPSDPQSCGPLALRADVFCSDLVASEGVRSAFAVTATGYSSTVEQCDDTPHVTASNRSVRWGVVALSRDLLREFTPGAPFTFGDKVLIPGVGLFVVEDTMSWRFKGRVDIWFPSTEEASHWGVKKVRLVPA